MFPVTADVDQCVAVFFLQKWEYNVSDDRKGTSKKLGDPVGGKADRYIVTSGDNLVP